MSIARRGTSAKKVSEILDEKRTRKEKKHQTTFYLPESRYKELKRYCFDHDLSMTEFLEELCAEKLKKESE